MLFAQILVYSIFAYVIVGAAFSLFFVFVKAHRIDPAAKGAGFFFKLIIFFGSAVLWPVLVFKLLGDRMVPSESNAHRDLAGRIR